MNEFGVMLRQQEQGKTMFLPFVLVVAFPVAIALANLAIALMMRNTAEVRAHNWRGVLLLAGHAIVLWLSTSICWIACGYPFGSAFALGDAEALISAGPGGSLPPGYDNTGSILYATGFGNPWWLVLILAVDLAIIVGLRKRTPR